jgi:hypothetical protein
MMGGMCGSRLSRRMWRWRIGRVGSERHVRLL